MQWSSLIHVFPCRISTGIVDMAESDKHLTSNDQEPRTIFVQGLTSETDQELLELYFENDKCGGGDIESITLDKEGVAQIIFKKREGN